MSVSDHHQAARRPCASPAPRWVWSLRRSIVAALAVALCACGSSPSPGPDSGRDAGGDADVTVADADDGASDAEADTSNEDADVRPDADDDPDGDGDELCSGPGTGCTCVVVPVDVDGGCWHRYGGLYGPGACSADYQCCDGTWVAGQGSCGDCTCIEMSGIHGCVGLDDDELVCFPEFDGTATALPSDVTELMTGLSWREGCPVGLEAFSLLEMPHWGFDGEIHRGRMVVATSVAEDVLDAFNRIYDARFPIERMRLVDEYDADDDRSMADNNTSAFNCRAITGGTSWSEHSYGTAIDINPVQNPYVVGSTVLPPAGAPYVDRTDVRAGMIVEPGPVTAAFDAIGWGWGGRWSSLKDYQHFSESGR